MTRTNMLGIAIAIINDNYETKDDRWLYMEIVRKSLENGFTEEQAKSIYFSAFKLS